MRLLFQTRRSSFTRSSTSRRCFLVDQSHSCSVFSRRLRRTTWRMCTTTSRTRTASSTEHPTASSFSTTRASREREVCFLSSFQRRRDPGAAPSGLRHQSARRLRSNSAALGGASSGLRPLRAPGAGGCGPAQAVAGSRSPALRRSPARRPSACPFPS